MSCQESSGAGRSAGTIEAGEQWLEKYMRMNAQLLQSALNSYSPLVEAWTSWYQVALPAQFQKSRQAPTTHPHKAHRGCCEIPDTTCPPRCAGTIEWHASQGEIRKATIEIRNTSKETLRYQLVPGAFQSCGKSISAQPVVTPTQLNAAAGETVNATVETLVGDSFQPGLTYRAEIKVTGKYERCVCVELHVRCAEEEAVRFDLGDIPYRTRADEWYRHFQCSEPCFEPVAPTQKPTPVAGPPAGTVNQPK